MRDHHQQQRDADRERIRGAARVINENVEERRPFQQCRGHDLARLQPGKQLSGFARRGRIAGRGRGGGAFGDRAALLPGHCHGHNDGPRKRSYGESRAHRRERLIVVRVAVHHRECQIGPYAGHQRQHDNLHQASRLGDGCPLFRR
jgi:hypothetical protein